MDSNFLVLIYHLQCSHLTLWYSRNSNLTYHWILAILSTDKVPQKRIFLFQFRDRVYQWHHCKIHFYLDRGGLRIEYYKMFLNWFQVWIFSISDYDNYPCYHRTRQHMPRIFCSQIQKFQNWRLILTSWQCLFSRNRLKKSRIGPVPHKWPDEKPSLILSKKPIT